MTPPKRKAAARGGVSGAGLARVALVVFALALVVRLVYLGEIAKSPTFHVPIIDSASYDQHARLLVEKGIFYQRFFWQGFLYPFFLAAVYSLTNGSMLAARLMQIALGSLLCAGVFHLGAKLFDRRTGVVAGVAAALYGPLVFYDAELLDTGLSALWAVALLLLVLRARDAKGVRTAAIVGVCGGLSVVTRATFLPYLVVACGWLLLDWRRRGARPALVAARGGLMLAGFLAVALPVAQLCYEATGDFNFLSESGPINLYIGNNPERDRTIMIRPGEEWRELTRLPAVKGSSSDSEDRNLFTRLFLDYVRARPADFAKGLAEKSAQFVSSRELPRNEDMYAARRYSRLLSALTWKAGGFGFPFGLLLPLALVGVVRYAKRIPVPIYGFLLLYPAAIVGVFVSGRYRMPIVPILIVPAAAGARYCVDTVRARAWRRAAAIAAAACAVAVATSVAGPFAVEKFDYEAEMHTIVGFELMKQNRAREALAEFSEALRLEPNDSDAHKYIGIIMSGERRHGEAEVHLRKALESKPDSYLIRYYLAIALLNQGKREEARGYLAEARAGAVAAKEERLLKEIDKVLGSLAEKRQQPDIRPRGTSR
jgi:4-amino-4-deoxy-L-arabinose transferase-like glycosyltransferase